MAWVGAGTALMAAILACAQNDIKRVLAYSTVSQLGYMMTAIGAGFASAGFLHLLTHGIFKALLFLGAGAVIHAVGTNDITHMGGLGKKMPQTMVVFLVGTLSLAGLPFFAGFLSRRKCWRRLGRRDDRAVRVPADWRIPDGLLHVPRGVPDVLRCARSTGSARRHDAHRTPKASPRARAGAHAP